MSEEISTKQITQQKLYEAERQNKQLGLLLEAEKQGRQREIGEMRRRIE